eukprot:XP_001698779.1 predicted protein [Chlamydomonas reinhardtii]
MLHTRTSMCRPVPCGTSRRALVVTASGPGSFPSRPGGSSRVPMSPVGSDDEVPSDAEGDVPVVGIRPSGGAFRGTPTPEPGTAGHRALLAHLAPWALAYVGICGALFAAHEVFLKKPAPPKKACCGGKKAAPNAAAPAPDAKGGKGKGKLLLATSARHASLAMDRRSFGVHFGTRAPLPGTASAPRCRDVWEDVALLPLKQVLAILVSLAAAIKAMHRVGLVHNDVKPANMLHRADDTYCLADFGLAEQLSPADPTGTFFFEMACGTRHYMAPEVQSNVPLTAAVDVYSFGITALCVAVTGSNSAAADWFAQQSWWPAGDAPAAARAFPAGIFPSYLPLSLELLLLDCVAWDPQERPTAEQVVQRLAAIWEEVVVAPRCRDVWEDVALLPLKQVLAILVSLAAAIKAMHRVGLVHNDVKPANMLHRADDTYCLADFGLAEQLSPADPTGTFFFEMACGTRHYMAPEVQSNVPLTAAVDVYSFGITALCVAVTGSNSAAADWFAQQSWWPAGDAPAAARAFPAGIFPSYLPLSLELLLLDCVAWDPQERPTAEQVVQRLAAIWEEVVVCGY